jgi:hypothetical protein
MSTDEKPLGRKAYGSIPHLPGSRMGPGDHHCHEGQAHIATVAVRDRQDAVYVQEKLDGSCVSVAKIGGKIVALGRAGYLASTSPFEQHHLFNDWAIGRHNRQRFSALLGEGERAVGEWLAQAHGTRYDLSVSNPFVLFDIMRESSRAPLAEVTQRAHELEFDTPFTFNGPMSVAEIMRRLDTYGYHGATDPVEGAVWRVERDGAVDFLVKFVRPDKVDGLYLPEVSGKDAVWNWTPSA